MRDCGNHDLKVEVDLRREEASKPAPRPTSARDMAEHGYVTLDRASTDPYARKERKGLAPDANFPRRY